MIRAAEKRPADRSVGEVELPDPFSGWFDLLKNNWVYEMHPQVDRVEEQIAVMQWKVKQFMEGQPRQVDGGGVLAAKQLLAELGGLAGAI